MSPEASFSRELRVRTAPRTAAVQREVGCLPKLALRIVFILKWADSIDAFPKGWYGREYVCFICNKEVIFLNRLFLNSFPLSEWTVTMLAPFETT